MHSRRVEVGEVEPHWSLTSPIRIAADRRQALVEIDALLALGLGLSDGELCTIYRTQFPVLYGYDRSASVFDANGRLVPSGVVTTWRSRGGNTGLFAGDDLSAAHPGSGVNYAYELPFVTLDRESDLTIAYGEFSRRLGMRS